MSRASRRMAAFVLLAIALATRYPCAAQTPDTARFTASGIGVTLVLADTRARPLRTEAERAIRGGLEEFTAVFDGSPRNPRSRRAPALTVHLSTGVANEGDSDPGLGSRYPVSCLLSSRRSPPPWGFGDDTIARPRTPPQCQHGRPGLARAPHPPALHLHMRRGVQP